MKTPAQALRDARALIPDEAHWWRGPKSGRGGEHCHCIVTAVLATMGRTLAEVWAAFDRAIELAEAK
jgi:hypothetical protein